MSHLACNRECFQEPFHGHDTEGHEEQFFKATELVNDRARIQTQNPEGHPVLFRQHCSHSFSGNYLKEIFHPPLGPGNGDFGGFARRGGILQAWYAWV